LSLLVLCPQGVNATDLARTVYSGIPDDAFLSISFSASDASRAFIWRGAYNKMSSSETESTASDMSDLSYEKVGKSHHPPVSLGRTLTMDIS
jgi:hypothetical protein